MHNRSTVSRCDSHVCSIVMKAAGNSPEMQKDGASCAPSCILQKANVITERSRARMPIAVIAEICPRLGIVRTESLHAVRHGIVAAGRGDHRDRAAAIVI